MTVSSGLAGTAFALAVLIPLDAWVLVDARARGRAGAPVRLRLGALTVEAPAQWFVGCLVLFVAFFPACLAARTAAYRSWGTAARASATWRCIPSEW
jgi:hypothetical protein